MTPVTFVPMAELIVTLPEPLPELVIVPLWFTEVVDNVIELVLLELLFFKVKLPVPVVPFAVNLEAARPERLSSKAIEPLPAMVVRPVKSNWAVPLATFEPPRMLS